MVIEFNISTLVNFKLTFEEYFLLFCIKNSHKDVLLNYVKNIKPFPTEMIQKLEEEKFLTYSQDSEGLILFSSLKLGDKAVTLFPTNNQTFEVCFAELKQTYPKSFGERKLHLDNTRCIEIYKKTILHNGEVDVDKHNLILKCIKLYVHSLTKSGKMNFIQALPTFLHQKNWEAYLDEARNGGEISEEEDLDAI